ncbi:MAG: radical SAM protein [Myxococcota bacterium]
MSESPAKPAIYIETYGCQMNVLDSELVHNQFSALGYQFAECAEDAGVVLLNTCSVRQQSEQKVWSKLGRLAIHKKKQRPDMVIGVIGCMAEREGTEITRRMKHVDVLCGPSNLDQLPSLVANALHNQSTQAQVSLSGHNSRRSKTYEAAMDGVETLDLSRAFSPTSSQAQAYVRITRGCNKFCSFCVVPFTRGPEVHRSPQQIIDEVQRLVQTGVVEVTLLGQTVNHYAHQDGGKSTSFADLLWRVHEAVPDLRRLRFLTSYPRDFTDEALRCHGAVAAHLSLPSYSGAKW